MLFLHWISLVGLNIPTDSKFTIHEEPVSVQDGKYTRSEVRSITINFIEKQPGSSAMKNVAVAVNLASRTKLLKSTVDIEIFDLEIFALQQLSNSNHIVQIRAYKIHPVPNSPNYKVIALFERPLSTSKIVFDSMRGLNADIIPRLKLLTINMLLALQDLQRMSFSHLEITPNNIFSFVKFGAIEFKLGNFENLCVDSECSTVLTNDYAAPEMDDFVFRQMQHALSLPNYDGFKADMFSLGAIICRYAGIGAEQNRFKCFTRILTKEEAVNHLGGNSFDTFDFCQKLVQCMPLDRMGVNEALEHAFIK